MPDSFFCVPETRRSRRNANPGTLNGEKLEAYRRAGINRLSIGLQSADNRELKTLGRIHTWEQFLENYELVRKIRVPECEHRSDVCPARTDQGGLAVHP